MAYLLIVGEADSVTAALVYLPCLGSESITCGIQTQKQMYSEAAQGSQESAWRCLFLTGSVSMLLVTAGKGSTDDQDAVKPLFEFVDMI